MADWPLRVGAYLVDFAVIVVGWIVVIVVVLIAGAIASALGFLVALLGYLALAAYGFFLSYQTGAAQTLGKRVMGVKVVRMDTLQPIGGGMGIVRGLAHFLDGFCLIGYLWPLWDPLKQTFADKIMSTVAITVPRQPFDLKYITATS